MHRVRSGDVKDRSRRAIDLAISEDAEADLHAPDAHRRIVSADTRVGRRARLHEETASHSNRSNLWKIVCQHRKGTHFGRKERSTAGTRSSPPRSLKRHG